MRTTLLYVLLSASQSLSSAFIINNNKFAISAVKWQPLAAEALQDAVQDAFAYFSQLPPEQVQSDLIQRGEWYKAEQFPQEMLATPKTQVKDCSSRVSIQTGLFQENGDWIMYRFQGETDSTVLRGLIQILSDITQEVPISEVMSLPPFQIVNALGLQSALSQSDSNDMSMVWYALQQQIQETLSGNSQSSGDSSGYGPSTMGTSIPGAGNSKPAVKKGWSPGSSGGGSNSQSNASGSAPPFAIWDPTSASAQSSPSPSPPSSSPSDRLSRLDRLSSPSTTTFADGAEVDASASKAPWDNWTPPPQNTQSSEAPSTLGTSIPGAGSSKPAVKKGWGPGSSSDSNGQANASGSAPPFAIWDPTSASAQSSPSPSPPSSSPSDRLSRLDRLSSPSTTTFADGAQVDASASKAPWDNWTPPPQNTQSTSSGAPSTMGTSIPGASSPSDRLSRLDRLSSPSTPKFADGAEVDASASKAPWDNWTPPQKTQSNGSGISSSTPPPSTPSDRVSRRDRSTSRSTSSASFADGKQNSSFDTSAKTTSRSTSDNYAKPVVPSESSTPLGPAFGIETAPKSPWKAEPSPDSLKPLTSTERPPWENASTRSPQSSLNPLSGKAPDQRWHQPPIKNDVLQPQEVTSSSFRASNSGSSGSFVQNSKKVFDSIPKSEAGMGSTLGPDFVESDRYKIKNPADSSRSVPSNPWRQTTTSSSVGGSRNTPLTPNSPKVSSSWKTSDGIDPLPLTPKNLQTPGVSASNNPFSPAAVGPQSTISSTPWTGSTPSTAGSARVTLEPQNYSPTTGTMSSWTGSTPSTSRGSQAGPFQERSNRGPQAGPESWEPSSTFPTKLGDFTTEVNRKPRDQPFRAPPFDSPMKPRDRQPNAPRERESFRGRTERSASREPTQTNPSFDAEILKDIGNGRQSRVGAPPENKSDFSRGAPFGASSDRDTGSKRPKADQSWTDQTIRDNSPPSTDTRKKTRPGQPRTYLDIVTGNYEREAANTQPRGGRDQDFPGSPFRGAPPGPASKSTTRAPPGKEAYRVNNEPRGPPSPRAPFRGAGQGPRGMNEPGYEARRSPYNEDARPRPESYRSPPRRPDQKPYVDRIIPTRPFSNEGPMYPPYDGGRMNDDRWQQRDSRMPPPPGPPEYFDYRGEGPGRTDGERFQFRDDAWRPRGQERGPGNGRYDDPLRPRDMMPPRN